MSRRRPAGSAGWPHRLAGAGLTVAVEAFPWSALSSPMLAAQVLAEAAAPNAGLMIDVWHFFNAGADPEWLAGQPIGTVAAVQLNDGPRVHDDFLQYARSDRRLPGNGDLDVVGLLQAVVGSGFDGPYCVEANTPEFRALPVTDAAHRAADAARETLAKAGIG